MTTVRILFAALVAVAASSAAYAEPLGLSGFYKGDGFSMNFDGAQCSAISPAGEVAETKCIRKGNLVYIAPIVPNGQRMIRNVWVAYTVVDDRLESSHVEDMDDGQVFYKDQRPKLVLKKQTQ
jgi:hypothetical protein